MELLIGQGRRSRFLDMEQTWPLDARMALFLLESEGIAATDAPAGRELDRFRCRVRARLVRIRDGRPENIEIYVRDLSVGHVGFICDQHLDANGEYQLHFTPSDSALQLHCAIGRSRPYTDGWFEGVAHLHETHAATTVQAPLRLAV